MENSNVYNPGSPVDSKLYLEVEDRAVRAFRNLQGFHDECRANINAYHSWENRKHYSFHNNIDVPLYYKVVESLVPYFSGGSLEPGCIPVRPEDTDSAASMNKQIKYYNNTRPAKKAFAEATRWKIITGVGFIKDGWDFKQDRHRRWVSNDEELLLLASECGNKELKKICDKFMSMDDAAQAGVSPDQVEALNSECIEEVKAFLRKKDRKGKFPVPTLEPSSDGFITYDVDQYDSPALEAIPTYDVAWLGSGQDIQNYESIYHRYWMSRTKMKRLLKGMKANKTSGWRNLEYCLKAAEDQNTESELVAQKFNSMDLPEPGSIELIEETRRDENGDIVVTTICKKASCVVRHMKSPFFHNQFNFTRLVVNPSISDIRGISIFRPIESLCAAVIKQFNSLLDNSDLIQNPAFRVNKGSQMNDRQMSIYTGKIIYGRQGDFEPIAIPDIRAATQNIISFLISMIFSITGCPEVLDSVIPFMGNGNGKADVEELKFSTTARIRNQLNSDSVALAGLMERECSNIMQFNRYPTKIPFVLNGQLEYIDYQPGNSIGSFKFLTDASTMIAPDPSVLRAQLTGLINMAPGLTVAHLDEESGQLVQRNQLNIRNLLRMWAETSGVGDPDQFFVSPSAVEAIPAQALPPLPQPEQQPQGKPQQGHMNPEQPPTDEQVLSQLPPEFLQQAAQNPEILDQLVQQGQIPPEAKEQILRILKQNGMLQNAASIQQSNMLPPPQQQLPMASPQEPMQMQQPESIFPQLPPQVQQILLQNPQSLASLVQQGLVPPELAEPLANELVQLLQPPQASPEGVYPPDALANQLALQGSPVPPIEQGPAVPFSQGFLPEQGGSLPLPVASVPSGSLPGLVPPAASPAPLSSQLSDSDIQALVSELMSMPPDQLVSAFLSLAPDVMAVVFSLLPPEVQKWLLSNIPQDLASLLANPQGLVPNDQGIPLTPEMASAALAGSEGASPSPGGGMNTATGTNGMPPMLGGTQQAGSGIVSPQQVGMQTNTSDVRQSSNTIQ